MMSAGEASEVNNASELVHTSFSHAKKLTPLRGLQWVVHSSSTRLFLGCKLLDCFLEPRL